VRFPANIHAETKTERQTPTHYAAKNDAAKALKKLLDLGGRSDSRDYKGRTPLQVAAELGNYWIEIITLKSVFVLFGQVLGVMIRKRPRPKQVKEN